MLFLSSSSHNSLNFCLICKNWMSKSKLSFLLSHLTYFVNISGSKLNNTYAKLCTIFGTPGRVRDLFVFCEIEKHGGKSEGKDTLLLLL